MLWRLWVALSIAVGFCWARRFARTLPDCASRTRRASRAVCGARAHPNMGTVALAHDLDPDQGIPFAEIQVDVGSFVVVDKGT